ncbi:MAG: aspartate 1-decarboxylase [Rhodothermales bacterium]
MRSKIHKAVVTEADVDYVGSVTIDEDLMDLAGIWHWEKVLIVSNTSGARLETYAIPGPRGAGDICINGAAAHLIGKGEEVIIIAFELTDKPVAPKAVLVDRENRFVRYLNPEAIIEDKVVVA